MKLDDPTLEELDDELEDCTTLDELDDELDDELEGCTTLDQLDDELDDELEGCTTLDELDDELDGTGTLDELDELDDTGTLELELVEVVLLVDDVDELDDELDDTGTLDELDELGDTGTLDDELVDTVTLELELAEVVLLVEVGVAELLLLELELDWILAVHLKTFSRSGPPQVSAEFPSHGIAQSVKLVMTLPGSNPLPQ